MIGPVRFGSIKAEAVRKVKKKILLSQNLVII